MGLLCLCLHLECVLVFGFRICDAFVICGFYFRAVVVVCSCRLVWWFACWWFVTAICFLGLRVLRVGFWILVLGCFGLDGCFSFVVLHNIHFWGLGVFVFLWVWYFWFSRCWLVAAAGRFGVVVRVLVCVW